MMIRMVKACDPSQRRLAAFLIIVVVCEVLFICCIIKHEHNVASDEYMKALANIAEAGNRSWELMTNSVDTNVRNKTYKHSLLFKPVRKSKGTTAHFTFGNDKLEFLSTYQKDFGFILRGIRSSTVKTRTFSPAQIFPYKDRQAEANKWVSSAMGDFAEFGSESRSNVYNMSKFEFTSFRAIQTKPSDLLNEVQYLPVSSMYANKLTLPRIYAPCLPRHVLKMPTRHRTKLPEMVTEAGYSYQWPEAEKIQLPPILKKRVNNVK